MKHLLSFSTMFLIFISGLFSNTFSFSEDSEKYSLPDNVKPDITSAMVKTSLLLSPLIDLEAYQLKTPFDGCGLGIDTITVCFRHLGSIPFTGGITAYYQVNGGTVISESLSISMNPGDSVCYSFNTLHNFSVTASDSLFGITAWVKHAVDSISGNDTVSRHVLSMHTPPPPVGQYVTIPYATQAQLHATSPTGNAILWFPTVTGGNPIGTGSPFYTGILFTDTIIYAETYGAVPFQKYILGNGSLINSHSSYPSPYGNFFWGNKEQYIIRASELSALGIVAGQIASIAFNVVIPGGIPLYQFSVRMGHTTQSSASKSFIDSGLTQVFHAPVYTDYSGWNNHVFQNPFNYDGVSNLVVEVCFNNSNHIRNGVVRQTGTQYSSTTQYNADKNDVCLSTSAWNTYNQRPDMQIMAGQMGCSGSRVPVQVIVQSQQACDAGVDEIISPVSAYNLGVQEEITVRINNWGSLPVTNFPVRYQINNNSPVTDIITDTIHPDSFLNYAFNTKANLGMVGTTYQIRAWTCVVCDVTPQNDSALKYIENMQPQYCLSKADNPFNQEITNVTLNTINNSSDSIGSMYTDFTGAVLPTILKRGIPYQLSVSSSFTPDSSSQNKCYLRAWIDSNRDGVFNPSGELIFSKSTTSSAKVSGTIYLPYPETPGITRMRVVLSQTNTAASVTPCGTYDYGETEDYTVIIAPQASCDAGISEITTPDYIEPSGLLAPVWIKYGNFSYSTIQPNDLEIIFRMNNDFPIVHPVQKPTANGATDSVLINSVYLPPGYNELCAYTSLNCDTVFYNDKRCKNVFGETHAYLPYYDEFETGNFWYKPLSSINWQYGTPTASKINSAFSGTKAWATQLAGNYTHHAEDFLYSPKFNFQGLTGYDTVLLGFYHYCAMVNGDFGIVQYSIDGGASWSDLGVYNDVFGINWYNACGDAGDYFSYPNSGWIYSAYKLNPSDFNGLDPVQFRFKFVANSLVTDNGWAIDNFRLDFPPKPNDVGVASFINPPVDTAAGSLINNVSVMVANYGMNALDSIPIVLKLNGSVISSDTIFTTLLPQSEILFTFSNGYTVPGNGYQLCAETMLSFDDYNHNNSHCKIFIPLPADTDVGIGYILEPVTDSLNRICSYIPQVAECWVFDVSIRIQNFGQVVQISVPFKYSFYNGGPVYNEIWNGNLQPGGYVDLILTNKFKPLLGDQYICVETELQGDVMPSNNSACRLFKGLLCSCYGNTVEYQKELVFLHQNIPNPASTATTIGFKIPFSGEVKFGVINPLGQQLYDQLIPASGGENEILVNLDGFAAGICYYYIEYEGRRLTRKMVIRH